MFRSDKKTTTPMQLSTAQQSLFAQDKIAGSQQSPKDHNDLIAQVIACASEEFKKPVNQKILADDNSNAYFSKFPNANQIKGTHIIASAGPKNVNDLVAKFIESMLFNENISIQKIIAIGSSFGARCGIADYFNDENKNAMYGAYKVDAVMTLGHFNPDHHTIDGFVKSELTIKDLNSNNLKKVNVTVIPLFSSQTFNFDKEDVNSPFIFDQIPVSERLETLWQLYNDTQNENVLIHCTSGEGRTGNLVLTFELLREYDRIFASGKPEVIAQEIKGVLDRIRQSRPLLIRLDKEFVDAIRNADTLHRYGLERTAQLQSIPQQNKRT